MSQGDRFLDSFLGKRTPGYESGGQVDSFRGKKDAGLCMVVRWAVPDVPPGVTTEKTLEPFPLAL